MSVKLAIKAIKEGCVAVGFYIYLFTQLTFYERPIDLGDSHILGTGHMKYFCSLLTVMLRFVPGGVLFCGKMYNHYVISFHVSLQALSHGAIFLATCNVIPLLRCGN